MPDLVTGADIGRMAGVTRQRGHKLTELEGFPRPAVKSSRGSLWRRDAVEVWLKAWPRLPGRKRRTKRPQSGVTASNTQ